MIKKNKFQRVVIRTALSAAMLLTATSASAATVTVDGNLSDLITVVSSAPYNAYSGSDPMGSADSPVTESNNGFDIKNVYAYYNTAGTGTLYLGMSMFGTVGDSRAVSDTTSLHERTTTNLPNANRSIFDSNESYGFSLFEGTTTTDPGLLAYSVVGLDAGGNNATGITNPYGLTVTHAVSESFNGVEFKIVGLNAQLTPFGFSNPANLLILFKAGSGDANPVSTALEDSKLLQTQVVPVPAAAWLLGSGLVGLLGLSRRQRKIPLA